MKSNKPKSTKRTSPKKTRNRTVRSASTFSKSTLFIFALVFAVIGGWFIYKSFAVSGILFPPSPRIYLRPSASNVSPNGTITLEIREDSGTKLTNATEVHLAYPANKLSFIGLDNTSSPWLLFSQGTDTSTPGALKITKTGGTGSNGGLTGDQLIAKVTFRAANINDIADLSFTAGTVLVATSNQTNLIGSLDNAYGAYLPITPSPLTYLKLKDRLAYDLGNLPVAQSTEFIVEVRENSGTIPVNSASTYLNYSPNYLDFVKVEIYENALNTTLFPNPTTAPWGSGGNGQVQIPGRSSNTNVVGDKTVAFVHFRTKTTTGTTGISFSSSGNKLMDAGSNRNIFTGTNNLTARSLSVTIQ
jgi:hypothetical protein